MTSECQNLGSVWLPIALTAGRWSWVVGTSSPRPDCDRTIGRSANGGFFRPAGLAFEVTCTAALRTRADQGAGLCVPRRRTTGQRRAPNRSQLVSAGALFRRGCRELEARRTVANRFRGPTASPVRLDELERGPIRHPGRGPASTSTPTRSATAKATRTARSFMPSLDPQRGRNRRTQSRPYGRAPACSRRPSGSSWSSCPAHGSRLFITARSSTAQPSSCPGSAWRGQHDQAADALHHPRVRRRPFHGPAVSRIVLDWRTARTSSGCCSTPTAAPAITSSPIARPTARAARPWSKSSFPLSSSTFPASPIPVPACSTAIPRAAGAASGSR